MFDALHYQSSNDRLLLREFALKEAVRRFLCRLAEGGHVFWPQAETNAIRAIIDAEPDPEVARQLFLNAVRSVLTEIGVPELLERFEGRLHPIEVELPQEKARAEA